MTQQLLSFLLLFLLGASAWAQQLVDSSIQLLAAPKGLTAGSKVSARQMPLATTITT